MRERNATVSPQPARDTLVAKVDRIYREHFPDTPDTKKAREVRLEFADRLVDTLCPGLHPRSCAGRSLQDMMWDELLTVVDRLVQGDGAEAEDDRGKAQGIAYCLAITQNPYKPNMEAIREEAMRRYEEQFED
jgi:hypothetical protein